MVKTLELEKHGLELSSEHMALQGPTSFALLRDAGFAGIEKLKPFDLADFPHETAP